MLTTILANLLNDCDGFIFKLFDPLPGSSHLDQIVLLVGEEVDETDDYIRNFNVDFSLNDVGRNNITHQEIDVSSLNPRNCKILISQIVKRKISNFLLNNTNISGFISIRFGTAASSGVKAIIYPYDIAKITPNDISTDVVSLLKSNVMSLEVYYAKSKDLLDQVLSVTKDVVELEKVV